MQCQARWISACWSVCMKSVPFSLSGHALLSQSTMVRGALNGIYFSGLGAGSPRRCWQTLRLVKAPSWCAGAVLSLYPDGGRDRESSPMSFVRSLSAPSTCDQMVEYQRSSRAELPRSRTVCRSPKAEETLVYRRNEYGWYIVRKRK